MRDHECKRPVGYMPEAEALQCPRKLHWQHLMAAMRPEGVIDHAVQSLVGAMKSEMVPQDGNVHERAARLENAADFPQRGIDVGDVFKRLRRGCGVTGRIFQSGIVGGSLKERDIREFTACCFGLLQLVGAWVKPIGDPVFANSLGKVPKKLSTATPDIDNAVTGLESQIFRIDCRRDMPAILAAISL